MFLFIRVFICFFIRNINQLQISNAKWNGNFLLSLFFFFLKQKTSLRRQTLNLKIFIICIFSTLNTVFLFLHLLFYFFCLCCMMLVGFKEFTLWYGIRNTQYTHKNMSNDLFIQIFLGFPKIKQELNVIYYTWEWITCVF